MFILYSERMRKCLKRIIKILQEKMYNIRSYVVECFDSFAFHKN